MGLPRPAFGAVAPTAFPSWIDRGARGVDPQREFFPLSRHACAREIGHGLERTLLTDTPDGYWDSQGARIWLRTRVAAPPQPDEEDWLGPDLEELDRDPPPVPDPAAALRIVRREVLDADRLDAEGQEERGDHEALRYWLESAKAGTILRVRITVGGRVVGRAEAKLEAPDGVADNAAELRLEAEDHDGKTTMLVVGGERVSIPWRATAGADAELAKRLLELPRPAPVQTQT
jgi:hypothetical protein